MTAKNKEREELLTLINAKWSKLQCPYCNFKAGKAHQVIHHIACRHGDKYHDEICLDARIFLWHQEKTREMLESIKECFKDVEDAVTLDMSFIDKKILFQKLDQMIKSYKEER